MTEQQQELDKTENDQKQEPKLSRDASLCREYFREHQAFYGKADVGGVCVERLLWTKPGSGINRVEFIAVRGRLYVGGDLGDAVYSTGADSLAWWGACDLHYFAGKCDASEYGRGYRTWDRDEALRRFREEVARIVEEEGEPVDAALVSDGEAALISGGYEWQRWMADEACEVFGSDWWEFVPKFGEVIDQRCALHLLGLKAALAQVNIESRRKLA